MRSIGQGFANAVDAAVIGRDQAMRDQTITTRETRGCRQAGCTRCCRKPGSDQFPAREIAHACSLSASALARPVIIARMRVLNPARQTIRMWIRTKSRRKTETKKWIVRADCWPPNAVTTGGKADAIAGDIARPVQITRGNRTKITNMYVSR